MQNLLLLSGSLRDDSVNTKLLKAFADAVADTVSVAWGSADLPLYNEDLEATSFPEAAQKLRAQVLAADVVVLSTPEYNRGMSGVLKNAIDWVSRPGGENAWSNKTLILASASPGSLGGAVAQYQLVQTMHHLGAVIPPGLEFILGHAYEKFDQYGTLTDMITKERIVAALQRTGIATKDEMSLS